MATVTALLNEKPCFFPLVEEGFYLLKAKSRAIDAPFPETPFPTTNTLRRFGEVLDSKTLRVSLVFSLQHQLSGAKQ